MAKITTTLDNANDVLDYSSKSNFPSTGDSGKIYIDKSTNTIYRWDGSSYVVVGSGNTIQCYDTGTSDTAGTWTVSIPEITELTEGLSIKIRLKTSYNTSGNTLNVNGLGAKTIYWRYGSKLTSHYDKESVLDLTYTESAISSGTDTSGWIVENIYYSTNVQQLRNYYTRFAAKSSLYRYMICFVNQSNELIPANGTSNSTATTKTLTTESFDLGKGIYYYNSTSTISAGSLPGTNTLYKQLGLIDLRYSFNTGTTLTANKPIYLVVSPQSDGQVKLSSAPIVQSLPTSSTPFWFVFLGNAYDTYRIELVTEHPIYVYGSNGLMEITSHVYKSLSTIPTKVSELTNDSGFTTNTGTITGITMNGTSKGTSGVVDLGTVITSHQDISGKADVSHTHDERYYTESEINTKFNNLEQDIDGRYATPSDIPTKVSELTNDSGFTTNTGTITGITMNGTSKGTSGVVDLGNIVTNTSNSNVNVAGTTKTVAKTSPETLFVPNGFIIGGTAAASGLVTRGICGCDTPNETTGATSKSQLYLNYDGNNTNNPSSRGIVINAGSTGSDLGNGVYSYCAVRGDAMKSWVEAKNYITSDSIPTKVSDLENDSGFTTNTGTVTSVAVKMNGSTKGTITSSGTIDLGTVITSHQDISGKANSNEVVKLTEDQTVSGVKTFNAPTNSSGTEQATMKLKTANGGSIIFGKEGNNSGSMIRLDQVDGTCRLRFRSSATAGAMVWEQPESGSAVYMDVSTVNFRNTSAVVFNNFKSAGYLYTDSNGNLAKGTMPTSLKNPNALTFGANTYDGSSAKTITASDLGALTSIPTSTNTVLGGIKPWYSTTGASTYNNGTSAPSSGSDTPNINARSTTSGKYYPIEMDVNGRAYVNVPWSNTTYTAGTNISITNNRISVSKTIPTVNDQTIKLYQGSSLKGSFTLNQSISQDIYLGGDVEITSDSTNKIDIINSSSARLLIQSGTINGKGYSGSWSVSFETSMPNTSYTVLLTRRNSSSSHAYVTSKSKSSFSIYGSSSDPTSSVAFDYVAICMA
ncbi:MAG: hypothetical protein ACI4VJ_00420 [Methanosphaera sp.]